MVVVLARKQSSTVVVLECLFHLNGCSTSMMPDLPQWRLHQARFSWHYNQSAAETWYPPGSLCLFNYRNASSFRHQFYTDLPGARGSRKVPRSEAFIDLHVPFEVLSTTHAVSSEGVAWITLELHVTDRYLDTVTVFTNASRDDHIWIDVLRRG